MIIIITNLINYYTLTYMINEFKPNNDRNYLLLIITRNIYYLSKTSHKVVSNQWYSVYKHRSNAYLVLKLCSETKRREEINKNLQQLLTNQTKQLTSNQCIQTTTLPPNYPWLRLYSYTKFAILFFISVLFSFMQQTF